MLFDIIKVLANGYLPTEFSSFGNTGHKMDKGLRRGAERFLKDVAPPLGNVLEMANNVEDTFDNFHDAVNPGNRLGHAINDLTVEEARQVFETGDHIAALRFAYSHHGIYDGHGGVYEYDDYEVRHSSLRKFADGGRVYLVNEDTIYSPAEIIRRADSRLGEDEYNLIFNNCENFATWCRLGEGI